MDTTTGKTAMTVEATVKAPIEKVWKYWTEPNHIMHWYNASDDWHAPYAENDLRTGGKFRTTMAAKDGSMSFDFESVYTNIQQYKAIEYSLEDGRKVYITFSSQGDETKVVEAFDPESINSLEIQRGGWQALVDNFKSTLS